MREISDSRLMEDYAAGSAAAFDELFRRYERKAYAYFLRRARTPERAGDLYQELFLRLHRFRSRYDPERPFAPWFFRIANRVWLDELRRRYREAGVTLGVDDAPTDEPSSERLAAAREEAGQLLGELSGEQARVLLLAKVVGSEYGEIAAELGKSVDATRQIGSRALRKLRRFSVGGAVSLTLASEEG